jgi:transcriptional regulator with XRE-family HTH domain
LNEDKQLLIEMGNRISKRRKELQLTQEQLAEAMDLSLQSISCIELGKKAIRPENLLNLCHCLNVSSDYILTGVKSANQLEGIFKKLATLSEDDYKMVESLVEHLQKRIK